MILRAKTEQIVSKKRAGFIRKGRFAWKLRTHFHAINVLFVSYGEMIQFFHRKPVEFRGITEKEKRKG